MAVETQAYQVGASEKVGKGAAQFCEWFGGGVVARAWGGALVVGGEN